MASCFLGDAFNHISISEGVLEFVTAGAQLLRLSADPSGLAIEIVGDPIQIASIQYVDDKSIDQFYAQRATYNANSHLITNLANGSANTDALNIQTANSLYLSTTTKVNELTAATAALSMNSYKITDVSSCTLNTDVANKLYVDTAIAALVASAPGTLDTLNELAAALADDPNFATTITESIATKLPLAGGTMTGAIAMGTSKITGIGNATTSTDAMNQQSCDARFYQNNVTLDTITAPAASVSLNSQKITNLSNATSDTDGLNRQTGDLRYYGVAVTLNQIVEPSGSVSMNTQKLTNLATCTLSTDAVNKSYVDTSISALVASAPGTLDTLNELATALGNDPNFATTITTLIGSKLPLAGGVMSGVIAMGTSKITGLGLATVSGDAMSQAASDARYYQSNVVLNSITAPTGSLSLNSQKITNLANAVSVGDAVSQQYGDSRYYLNNVVLNSITAPTGSLSLNSQKITTLATCTNGNDAANKTYVDTAISTYVLQQLRTRYATMSITVGNMLAVSSAQSVFTQPFPIDYPSLISSIYRTYVDGYSCLIAITYVSATLNLQNYKIWSCIRGTGVPASNANDDNYTAAIFNSTTNVLTLSMGGSGAFGNSTTDVIVDIMFMLKTDS